MPRQVSKREFLRKHLPGDYKIKQIAGDASFRKYDRIFHRNKTYILMDSILEHSKIEPFEQISAFLLKEGFSAPEIFFTDRENGLLLIEDFGDMLVRSYLRHHHGNREKMYKVAIDVLIALQSLPVPSWLSIYSMEQYLKELEIFTDYYIPFVTKKSLEEKEKAEYLVLWTEALSYVNFAQPKIVLKDYHVENLMYLNSREGIKSLGILDFQDALSGHPIYDLVSLLEDAREDVDFAFAEEMLGYYLEQNTISNAKDAYDILGAQRNARILGVFVRKKIRDNNANYLQYISRVEQYLARDMLNQHMNDIRGWHAKHIDMSFNK